MLSEVLGAAMGEGAGVGSAAHKEPTNESAKTMVVFLEALTTALPFVDKSTYKKGPRA
jgi:hypothetical protein